MDPADFKVLINNTLSENADIRDPAQKQYKQLQVEDPFTCIATFISIIREDNAHKASYVYLNRLIRNVIGGEFEGFPEDIDVIIKEFLIEFIQKTTLGEYYMIQIYNIASGLIKLFCIDQCWTDLIDCIVTQVTGAYQHLALQPIAVYASSAENDDQHLQSEELLGLEIVNPKAYPEFFNLSMVLMYKNEELITEELIDKVLSYLKIPGAVSKCIDSISKHFLFLQENVLEVIIDPLLSSLFEILAGDYSEGEKLSVIEIITDLFEIDGFSEFVLENADEVVQSLIGIFSAPADSMSPEHFSQIYENTIDMVEEMISLLPSLESLKGYFQQLASCDDQYLVSAAIRFLAPVDQFDTVFEMGNNEDIFVRENALTAVEKILDKGFTTVTGRNSEKMAEIFSALYDIYAQTLSPSALSAMTKLVNKATEVKASDFILATCEVVASIIENVFNDNTVFLAAALCVEAPQDSQEFAQAVLGKYKELLSDPESSSYSEDGTNTAEETWRYVSNFLKCFTPEEACQLAVELLEVNTYPNLPLWKGTDNIIKYLGANSSEIFQYILPKIFQTGKESVSYGFQDQADIRDSSKVNQIYIASKDANLTVNTEQVSEIIRALETLKSVVLCGADITEFGDEFGAVLESTLFEEMDMDIRSNAFELMTTIMIAHPDNATNYQEQISKIFSEVIIEPEQINLAKDFEALAEVVKNETCRTETLHMIAESMCVGMARLMTSLRTMIDAGVFNDTEEDAFLTAFWGILKLIKEIEIKDKPAAIRAFNVIYDFTQDIEVSAVKRMQIGLVLDFLEYVPENEKFEELFQFVVESFGNEDVEIRKLALYGFGRIVAAKHFPQESLPQFLDMLLEVIFAEGARDEPLDSGTDNAISSYSIILKSFNNPGYQGRLLEMLPVVADEDESRVVYEYLMTSLSDPKINEEVKQAYFEKIIEAMQDDRIQEMVQSLLLDMQSQIPAQYLSRLSE